MKQIMFERLTVDEQDLIRAGAELESEISPDASSCSSDYDRPTVGCVP